MQQMEAQPDNTSKTGLAPPGAGDGTNNEVQEEQPQSQGMPETSLTSSEGVAADNNKDQQPQSKAMPETSLASSEGVAANDNKDQQLQPADALTPSERTKIDHKVQSEQAGPRTTTIEALAAAERPDLSTLQTEPIMKASEGESRSESLNREQAMSQTPSRNSEETQTKDETQIVAPGLQNTAREGLLSPVVPQTDIQNQENAQQQQTPPPESVRTNKQMEQIRPQSQNTPKQSSTPPAVSMEPLRSRTTPNKSPVPSGRDGMNDRLQRGQLRSRATPSKGPVSSSRAGMNAQEREAMNARLSDRRRQRREERLGYRHRETSDPKKGAVPKAYSRSNTGASNASNTSNSTQTPMRRVAGKKRWSPFKVNNPVYRSIGCCLLATWACGLWLLAQHPAMTENGKEGGPAGPMQLLRRNREKAGSLMHLSGTAKRGAYHHRPDDVGAGIPSPEGLPPVVGNSDSLIDMRELNAHLDFANENGGKWTQGWDVQPVPIGKNEKPLRIFVVPHSHCDPGWIKTFDEYFQTQTKEILTSVMVSLKKNPERKFIWAEISYFEWWWREQSPSMQETARTLLTNGQFEFVTGGWVQPDEANTQLYAMEIQLQEGHDFIRETFGEEYIPKFGWSIDPFGYSPTMAYLLKKYKFEAMLIQRVHYRIKKELARTKHLEFMWRQTWDNTGEYDIFTHVMPFYSYDVPHTCGPDPSVCCTFDFARMSSVTSFAGKCPWGPQPQKIDEDNVAERAMLLLDQYQKKAHLYQSNVVIAPLGDDFRYRTEKEADTQYENYERIMEYINENVDGVTISFGTLSEYFKAAMGTFKPPLLKGSFFTYADRDEDYWSGYFTSRVFDKSLDRRLERALYAATSMGASPLELQEARRSLSLFQHHDGVTGTAKDHVVRDYARQIHTAIEQCQNYMISKLKETAKLAELPGSVLEELIPCWRSNMTRGMTRNFCDNNGQVLVYNPLETDQYCGSMTVPGGAVREAKLPCEKSGSLPKSSANIQFDPHTGLMTHPVKEEWMVWKVRSGGAYLFFPGKLSNYEEGQHDGPPKISKGGYVVETSYWRRKVIERSKTIEGVTTTIIEFVYETFLQRNNQEWLVRFTADDLQNEGVFHTDLNGFNFDTHHFRSDMPIQSQVFPMPTLASIEDERQRMTVLSEHAQGTASLEEGSIDVWLDRRLAQDDARGLGQGVKDNVPTRTRLRVVLETEGYKHESPEFEITPVCKEAWKELNHPLEIFGLPRSKKAPNHLLEMMGLAHSEKLPELPGEFFNKANNIHHPLNMEEDSQVLTKSSYRIPLVYMVYKRVDYLKQAIESLLASDFPKETTPIVISQDGHVDAMMEYVKSLQEDESNGLNVISLMHPHACSDHLKSFPGDDPRLNENYKGDSFGNPREGKVTCCKHHFTWLMNQVYSMDELRDADGFLFMEEDYIVAPTVYETIDAGLTYIDTKGEGQYFGLTLDPSEGFSFDLPKHPSTGWIKKRFVTGPMVLKRNMFDKIKAHAHDYCVFDEYNWDWSIVHLMSEEIIPYLVLVPRNMQVAHIGLEGGLHEESIDLKKRLKMERRVGHGNTLHAFHAKPNTDDLIEFESELHKHETGFGGWGHPADQQHCLELFGIDPESHAWSDLVAQ